MCKCFLVLKQGPQRSLGVSKRVTADWMHELSVTRRDRERLFLMQGTANWPWVGKGHRRDCWDGRPGYRSTEKEHGHRCLRSLKAILVLKAE